MNERSVLGVVWGWLVHRPLSRVGAVAAMAARRSTGSSSGPIERRIASQLIGAALAAVGIGTTLATDTGVGPMDVMHLGVAQQLHVPLAYVIWSVAGVLMIIATLLGNPPRIGTLITPFVLGAAIEPVANSLVGLSELPLMAGLGVQVVAVAVIGVGAGAIVVSGFGAGTGELISEATAWRFGRSMSTTRLGLEASFLSIGMLLGGPFGPGTIVVALGIGPAVSNGVRWCAPLVAAKVESDRGRGRGTGSAEPDPVTPERGDRAGASRVAQR